MMEKAKKAKEIINVIHFIGEFEDDNIIIKNMGTNINLANVSLLAVFMKALHSEFIW